MKAELFPYLRTVLRCLGKGTESMTFWELLITAFSLSADAFAAAVCPKRRALLPIGPSMSTVCTRTMPAGGDFTRTASSLFEKPWTMRPSGSGGTGISARICSSNSGAVFAAQPAPLVFSMRQKSAISPPRDG